MNPKTIWLSLLLLTPLAVFAGEVPYPYECPSLSSSEGMQWIYPWRFSCSLRQAPEKIDECKKKGQNGEAPFYTSIETTLERTCYNKNGRLRTSWCLTDHTWEQGTMADRYWTFQSAKVFQCLYN